MQAIIWLVALSFFSMMPGQALAADLTGTSRTYLQSRETAAGDKLLPIYEYLDLSVQNLGTEAISLHFGGWLGHDLQDDSFGPNDNNGRSLQYGYVSYRAKERNTVVNLGRIMVFDGVAAERVDGAYARMDLMGGFGVSAFGGVPVLTNLPEQPGNEVVYGARLSHQMTDLYTIGFSYLKSEFNTKVFREEQGVDLWLKPVNKVELFGRSSYNAETTGWMEHSYNLLLGPFSNLRLNTEVSQFTYENFFFGMTNSAFVFQPGGPIDPKENLGILGETASYAFTDNLSASV